MGLGPRVLRWKTRTLEGASLLNIRESTEAKKTWGKRHLEKCANPQAKGCEKVREDVGKMWGPAGVSDGTKKKVCPTWAGKPLLKTSKGKILTTFALVGISKKHLVLRGRSTNGFDLPQLVALENHSQRRGKSNERRPVKGEPGKRKRRRGKSTNRWGKKKGAT